MESEVCPHRLRKDLTEPLPFRIARLPISPRGYPVPWFVQWINGEPEFRVADSRKFLLAIKGNLCWVCGDPLGAYKTFTVGPMCGLNRTTTEPPSHTECAIWSAKNCPFLKNPNMVRRKENLPEGAQNPGGIMIDRNPGVTLLWTTKSFSLFGDGRGGVLIKMGEPVQLEWFKFGQPAKIDEIQDAIEKGCPLIREHAEKEGPESIEQFDAEKEKFNRIWRSFIVQKT